GAVVLRGWASHSWPRPSGFRAGSVERPPRGPAHLPQRVLHEESHELGAGGEGIGRRVAAVAVLRAAGPGVTAPFDGEEGDLGPATAETDLVDRRRRVCRPGPAAAVVRRPEADGGRDDGRRLDARRWAR